MANYECTQRTNYFHVKDPVKFREMMANVTGECLSFWENNDPDEKPMFAFGAEGSISGILHKDANGEMVVDDNSFDHFVTELSRHVADGEAVILREAGNEKLRYVSGSAIIITGTSTGVVDLSRAAVKLAREMLGDLDYSTQMDY